MAERRYLTSNEVLKWHGDWSSRDVLLLTAALKAIPDASYYTPPSGAYVGVEVHGTLDSHPSAFFLPAPSREGRYRALVIHRGWMQWPGGKWTGALDKNLFKGHSRW